MARGINKVILIGNLGNDPDIRYTARGSAVANISLATAESWRDKATGEQQERTEWHRVVVWGKQAETLSEYLTKGRQIYVEGRLQTRQWEDKEGSTRYTTEVRTDRVVLLGGRSSGASEVGGGEPQGTATATSPGAAPPELTEDDIPF